MLSYMLPVSEKPPIPPTANLATGGGGGGGTTARLQLALGDAATATTPPPPPPTANSNSNNNNNNSPPMPNGGPAPAARQPQLPTRQQLQQQQQPPPGVGLVAPPTHQPSLPPHAGGGGSSLPTDSSVSSLSSSEVGTTPSSQSTATPTDARPRNKLQANGKHPTLKRVSFGSSKGSMVETLVYESPLREEPEAISPSPEAASAALLAGPGADPEALAESKRVRVSFFECQRPVQLPPSDVDAATPLVADAAMAMTVSGPEAAAAVGYQRQASTDSGWDNPFRPDGNLSKEADEIVELIKGGKPITPTSGAAPAPAADAQPAADGAAVVDGASPVSASPQHAAAPGSPTAVAHTVPQQNNAKVGANGNAATAPGGGGGGGGAGGGVADGQKAPATPGNLEVQRGTVDPSQAVEHVVLKKKQKCKCCVIQ